MKSILTCWLGSICTHLFLNLKSCYLLGGMRHYRETHDRILGLIFLPLHRIWVLTVLFTWWSYIQFCRKRLLAGTKSWRGYGGIVVVTGGLSRKQIWLAVTCTWSGIIVWLFLLKIWREKSEKTSLMKEFTISLGIRKYWKYKNEINSNNHKD